MSDCLKSLSMLLQYLLNKPYEIMGFSHQIFFQEMQIIWLLLLMYVCRQLDYKPAKIPIEVASFIWYFTIDKSQGEHSLFPKKNKMLKNQTFPKSCGEHSK